MSKKVYIFQHVASEGAGTIADYLTRSGIEHEFVRLYEGAPLPPKENVAALCVMGGPMNVYEEKKYPFLKDETEFVGDLARKDVPVLGVCLGAQIIAKALGARVYKAVRPEIGWDSVRLSEIANTDRVFRVFPEKPLRVLQWHEDTFDLPREGVWLASSMAVPNQAFRFNKYVYGLQFHIEVTQSMLLEWFKDHKDCESILQGYEDYKTELSQLATAFYERFFSPIR